MNGIAAVFFDVGGPVYDDETFVVAVLGALDEMRGAKGLPPTDRQAFRRVYDQIRQDQKGSLRSALASTFLGDVTAREELSQRTNRRWVQPRSALFADVLPCLRALAGRVTIGVIANQPVQVQYSLRRDGVAAYVDVWGLSGLVELSKPDPRIFEWALQQAGVSAASAIHVGNRLDTDVRPAKALGMRTVWVLRGEAPTAPTAEQLAEPDWVVRDLDGLSDLVLSEAARR